MRYKKEILEIINDENHKWYYLLENLEDNLDKKLNPDRRYYCTTIDFDWEKNEIVWISEDESYHPGRTLDIIIDDSEIDMDNGYIRIMFFSIDKNAVNSYKKEMEDLLFKNCQKIIIQDRDNFLRWEKHYKDSFKNYLREDKLNRIIE